MDYNELAEYVERFKQGDERAFVRLYEQTNNLVYNIACSVLEDRDEAQDVVQEVFIKVYTRIDTLRDNCCFIRWLHVITANTCQDHIRSRSGFQLTAESDMLTDDPDLFNTWFEQQCRQDILSDMIRALPPEQMRTVYRYYYDQLPLGDIAALDNCSINTVKSRLFYARNTLRLAIEAEEKRLGEKLHLPAAITAMSAMMVLPQLGFVLSEVDAARILAAVFTAVGAQYAKSGFDIVTDIRTESSEQERPKSRAADFMGKSWFVRIKTSFFAAALAVLLLAFDLCTLTAYRYGASRITAFIPEEKHLSGLLSSDTDAPSLLIEPSTEPAVGIIKANRQPISEPDIDIEYQVIDGKAEILAMVSSASHLEVPDEVDGYPVSVIRERAFALNVKLQSVVIPGSVELIDDEAFAFCAQLERVVIRDGNLKKIGIDAFRGCSALTSVILPEGLQVIGKNAFRRTALQTIELPESLVKIGNQCFTECTELTEIRIPDGIDKIEDTTFMNCTKLSRVILPNHLREIGIDAFRGCVSLETIVLPDTIHVIYASAFYGSGLRKVILGETIGFVRERAFAACPNLEAVIVASPRDCMLESNAFADCEKLTYFEFWGNIPLEWGDNAIPANDRLTLYYHGGTEGWTEGTWKAPDGTVYRTVRLK